MAESPPPFELTTSMRQSQKWWVWMVIAVAALVLVPIAGSAADKGDSYGLVDPATGIWHLYEGGTEVASFYFGNPGDYPFMGDWDCDGIDTPGLYRQTDGYVYLRNSNTQGIANISFYFGNPGDVPVAGDFNGNGCDTVSIYRPSEARFFIINKLGTSDGGLGAAEYSFYFGNPGDKPFIGDFNGNGQDTIGLHRESTGLVYFRNTNATGIADYEFIYGDPGDRFVAGDWTGNRIDSPGVFRPSNTTMFLRYENSQGNADEAWNVGESAWLPVAGQFSDPLPPPPTTSTTTSSTLPPDCDPSYPDFCVPPPPPDLNCADIGAKNFTVLPPDPHGFDSDKDGIGCESETTSTTTTTTTLPDADTSPPVLVAFSFSPTSVDVGSSAQTVTASIELTDETGVEAPHIVFDSSTTTQMTNLGTAHLVSGSTTNGVWEVTVTVPQGSATGIWDAVLYPLSDTLGNSGSFGPPSGFPSELTVTSTTPP